MPHPFADARLHLAALVALSTSLPSFASAASFVDERANLHVLSPPDLRGSYDTAIGDFGVPNYGAKLIGEVFYDPGSNALWGTSYVFSRYLMKPMGWITAAVPVPNTS